jgi:hypothetical protein
MVVDKFGGIFAIDTDEFQCPAWFSQAQPNNTVRASGVPLDKLRVIYCMDTFYSTAAMSGNSQFFNFFIKLYQHI